MAKKLLVQPILGIVARPITIAKRDEDGRIVWKDEEKKIPQEEKMDTVSALEFISLSIPPELQTKNDSIQAFRVFERIFASKKEWKDGDGERFISLEDGEYDWIFRVLDRKVPLSKEQKEMPGLEPRTLAQYWWGMNAYAVERQLRVGGDRDLP